MIDIEMEVIDHRVQLATLTERLNNLPTRKELYAVVLVQTITVIGAIVALTHGVPHS